MKIIAKTRDGYLVEAHPQELANVAGYWDTRQIPSTDRDGTIPIGTQILVSETFQYLYALRQQQDKVKASESMLRALAEMLHSALPDTVLRFLKEETEGNDQ